MGILGNNIFGAGNHDSALGNIGKRFQKYTDPIAMIPGVGDKWVNLTSVEIPRLVNTGLSKVVTPFDRVDETINPVRRYIKPVDKLGDVIRDKPGSAIGTVVGGIFAAPAIGGALGVGGAGGAGGAAGGGGAALGGAEAGGLGAAGYGGGVGSSVLPGIFEGGSVGTGSLGGGSFFGGGLGTGSITGTSAPLFSSGGGLLGSGGAGLFGGNGLSTFDKAQLFQQGVNSLKPDQNTGTIQQSPYNQNAAYLNRPTATVTPNNSSDTNALIARLLMSRQNGY